jgi:N-acyl-D-aspartate/D-glutamate deacylase
MSEHLVLRGGTVVDGTGADPYSADVELKDGRIATVGAVSRGGAGGAAREIDAHGLLVTPGFIDTHTHYDGKVTWSERLLASACHGVTTAIVGNCGVGFAPCRPRFRSTLVRLMEDVEDIPGIVFAEGLPWDWESFPQYLDFLALRRWDVDIGAYAAHAPMRVWAMGERGAAREPATEQDRAALRQLAADAVRAGAFGFSSSHSIHQCSSDGANTPMYGAATEELLSIARGVGDAGHGLLQMVAGFTDPPQDVALMASMERASGRPVSVSLAQSHERPQDWKRILELIDDAFVAGASIEPQVCGRPVGMLLGLEAALNPFNFRPAYREIAHLPLADRVARLHDPALRARLLAETPQPEGTVDPRAMRRATDLEGLYELGEPPDYEPDPARSIAARARALGIPAQELALTLMLQDQGRMLFLRPLHNYAGGDLRPAREMLQHPRATFGLGDGGAHCGYICDASMTTHMLTHWVRDRTRGPRLTLPRMVRALTFDNAALLGLHDRGRVAPGLKADLNLIDLHRLRMHRPHVAHDLPGGGRRLLQDASGYVATIVPGEVTWQDGTPTDALPGRLVRSTAAAGKFA